MDVSKTSMFEFKNNSSEQQDKKNAIKHYFLLYPN